RLWVHVRDFSVRVLRVRVRVYDHQGKLVDEMARSLGDSQAGRWWWEPHLPRLGWYLLELGLIDDQKPEEDPTSMETVYGSLLWLGPPRAGSESSVKLVLDAQGRPNDEVDLLPQFMEQLGATGAVVSCWQPQTTMDNLDQQAAWLDQLLGRMTSRGQEVTLSFNPLPMALAHQINVDLASPLWMFSRPAEGWMPYVQPLLMQQGQRIRRWQLGLPGKGNLAGADELPQLIQTALATMRQLAPGPELILPWGLTYAAPDQALDDVGYAINIPTAFLPRFLPDAMAPWSHTDPPTDATLYLTRLSAGQFSHDRRIDDLARRMVYAWRSEPSRVALRAPWTVSNDRQVQLLPDPVAGVFATVGQLLAGRKYIQNLPLGDGIEAQIFHGPRGGMLVAWNESAEPKDAVIRTYLGENVTVTDVFGNTFSPPTVDGQQVVTLTHSPLFIEGIATELAIFRASFRLDPSQIPSTQEPHQHAIHLYNPWPRTISGQMLITDPRSWQIEPRRTTFSIPSGQSVTIPLWLSFPVSEVGGQQTLRARFDFVADRPYAIEMTTNVELGLSYLDWEAHLTIEEGPNGRVDLLVTQVVRNKGTQPLNLFAFAQLAEFSRQEQVISQLQPGQSLMRIFRFTDVGPHMQDQSIRVGIREDGGPAALNKVLRLY
ncbi:MAG: hypothetical protein IT441_05985, partial [Phycisphaeraceae bacterium]|nr:hypothetical protein [Phycisphaeraceae bacterium]